MSVNDNGLRVRGGLTIKRIHVRKLLLRAFISTCVIGAVIAVFRVSQNIRLFAAIKRNDAVRVQQLLRFGASPNARDYWIRGRDTDNIRRVLSDRLTGKTADGMYPTPLCEALDSQVDGPYEFACLPENPPLIKALLDAGADPRITGIGRSTPLEIAAGSGRIEIVKMLLVRRYAAQPEIDQAFLDATIFQKWSAAHVLLDAGGNPNVADGQGYSVLMLAVLRQQPDFVEALLRRGADPEHEAENGVSVLSLAISRGDERSLALVTQARGRRNQNRKN